MSETLTRRRLLSGTAATAAAVTTGAQAAPPSDLVRLVDQAIAEERASTALGEQLEARELEYKERWPEWPAELRWDSRDAHIIAPEPGPGHDDGVRVSLSEIHQLKGRRWAHPSDQQRADQIVAAFDRYCDARQALRVEMGLDELELSEEQQYHRAADLFDQVINACAVSLDDVRAKLRAYVECHGTPDTNAGATEGAHPGVARARPAAALAARRELREADMSDMNTPERQEAVSVAEIAAFDFSPIPELRETPQSVRNAGAHETLDFLRPLLIFCVQICTFTKAELVEKVRAQPDAFTKLLESLAGANKKAEALLEIIQMGEARLAVALAQLDTELDPDPGEAAPRAA